MAVDQIQCIKLKQKSLTKLLLAEKRKQREIYIHF